MRYAVWAAVNVYSLRTKDAINGFKDKDRVLLCAEHVDAAELIDASPSSYLKNTKNWAMFKDRATGTLCFAVRGTARSSLLEAVVDNITNIDASAIEAVQFGGKVRTSYFVSYSPTSLDSRTRIRLYFMFTEVFLTSLRPCILS